MLKYNKAFCGISEGCHKGRINNKLTGGGPARHGGRVTGIDLLIRELLRMTHVQFGLVRFLPGIRHVDHDRQRFGT